MRSKRLFLGLRSQILRTVVAAACCASLLAACRGTPPPSATANDDPRPARSQTHWTERTELFIEHRALIVGRETSFAAHVTVLDTFKPVTQGSLTLTLRCAGGTPLTSRSEAPLSPGIFRPVLTPTAAGTCRLHVAIDSPQLSDQFEVGPCEVHADLRAAQAVPEGDEPAGRIPFLKEQQWTTEFSTLAVHPRELQPAVFAYGELKPAAGKVQRLRAPIMGWLGDVSPLPLPGASVQSGQVLAMLSPRLPAESDHASLQAAVRAAQAEQAATDAKLKRSEDLVGIGAVSQQVLEDDRAAAQSARMRMEAATARLRQFQGSTTAVLGFPLRAPFAGTLSEVRAQPRELVEAGQHLFTVINQDRLWLEARVFEPDIPRVQTTQGAWFTVGDRSDPIRMEDRHGKLLSIGRVLDSESRTLPVIFEFDNADRTLHSGQPARVHLLTDKRLTTLALPDSAILDDAGRAVAYVQVEGESFERRVLSLGIRDRGFTEVRAGITAGERVVSRGAYEIKRASASGSVPAHGHAH